VYKKVKEKGQLGRKKLKA